MAWHKELLVFYSDCAPDDNIVDSIVINYLTRNAVDLQATELLPIITKLYDLNYIEDIADDREELLQALSEPDEAGKVAKTTLLTMLPRYEHIREDMLELETFLEDNDYDDEDGFMSEEIDQALDHYLGLQGEDDEGLPYSGNFTPSTETIIKERKPGRNEPCHCGSGKKYKKCCLGLDD
jgi:hypothetical protein